jgi:solute carrier family 25 protein 16
MAIETQHYSYRPSPWNAIRTIWAEGNPRYHPLSAFYRGFTISALGTVPYRGGVFLIWETLNAEAREQLSQETLNQYQTRIHLVIGAIAGTIAQVATYP